MRTNFLIETLLGLATFTIPTSAAATDMITCNEKEIRTFDKDSLGEAEIGAKTFQLQVGQKVDQDGDVIVLVMVGDHQNNALDQRQLIAMAKLVKGVEGMTLAGLFDQSPNKSAKAYVVDSRNKDISIKVIAPAKDFMRMDGSEQGLYGLTDDGIIQFELNTLALSGEMIPFHNDNTGFDPATIRTVSRPISKDGTTRVFLNGDKKVYAGMIEVPMADDDGFRLPHVLNINCETTLDNHTVYGGLIGESDNIAFRDKTGALQHLGIDNFLAAALPEQYPQHAA